MHSAFFAIKRSHLRVLAESRRVLKAVRCELTPARFDMLRVIHLHVDGIAQTRIIELLGLSGATVSRMLKSLEQREYIVRERGGPGVGDDRRRVYVRLQARGYAMVTHALANVVESGDAERLAVRGIVGNPVAPPRARKTKRAAERFEKILAGLRWVFRDTTPLRHPWTLGPIIWPLVVFGVDGSIGFRQQAC